MPPLHHRRPGLVGALLTSSATLTLIADGAHVDPIVIDLAVRAAGVERVALVSDAVAPAGAAPGLGALGTQSIESDGRAVRRADGTLAGSGVLLDACLRNARAWLPWLPPAQVARMATRTPAEALGGRIAARKGRVAPGYDADLVILAADWNVAHTIVRGEVVAAPLGRGGAGGAAGPSVRPSEEDRA
jgi:N-acetylglucosamine-6-phosphate deacetylase